MKKLYPALIIAAAILTSCSDNENYEGLDAKTFTVNEKVVDLDGKSDPEICAVTDLIAGQNYTAGVVEVAVDSENLYVTYRTSGNWVIGQTHLYLGTLEGVPQNEPGNPRVGHFPYQASHSAGTNEVTYTMPINDIDDCFYAAAHAVVYLTDDAGNVISSETAWGDGVAMAGKNWATVSEFCKTGCTNDDNDSIGGPIRRR